MKRPTPKLAKRRTLYGARGYLVPVIVFLCVALPHLDQGDWRTDAGWYGAIALSAWRDGSFLTLRGEPGQFYFNKPPMAFWIHGLSMMILGPTLVASRIPTVLAAAGCVACTSRLAHRFGSRSAALSAGLVMALTYEFFRRVREISLDMWQLLFMLLALCLAAEAVKRERGVWLLGAGAAIGLALLCKPLVALVLLPMLALWLAWNRQWRLIAWLAPAGLVALIVGGWWHVAMVIEHGAAFTGQYFGHEIMTRAEGNIEGMNAGAASPWYYAREVAGTYWPWMIPLVLSLITLLRGRPLSRDRRGARLALIWFVAWAVALSSFADKRPRYFMVVYPAWAMLAGMWMAWWGAPPMRRAYRALAPWFVPGFVVASIVFALAPVRLHSPPDPQWPELYAWLDASGDPELWQGGLQRSRGARLYVQRGRWPQTTRDRWNALVATPPEGALLLYHRRDGFAPGANEATLFETRDLRVTRLGPGGWSPVEVPDPGE
jgi:4-amino-4-deoxy-L-arabinose transferase-like glycosyltransferase